LTRKSKRSIRPSPFSSAEILQAFHSQKGQSMTFTEIAQALEADSSRRKELRQTLRALTDEHTIVKIDRRHYSLPPRKKKEMITGRVQAHRDGYGFLIPEDSSLPDIFLSKRETRDLMHQDRVALHPARKERGRRGAPRVVEVLERAHRRVVGRYDEGSKWDWVIPDEQRLSQPIRIPKIASGGARKNKIVLAEITRYPTFQEGPQGRILKVLGDPDDPRIDSEIIIHKMDLPDAFPLSVLKEASGIPPVVSADDLAGRMDLRGLNFFTIDGETARDFDDAVAVSRERGSRFKLLVSIADVGHYVREGSALDGEAFRRGTSVYFPERALPMLPPTLSTGICSLNPEEDRLCMTVSMEMDKLGRVLRVDFAPTVIHSRARLTYTLVKEMLQQEKGEVPGSYPSLLEDLRTMAELSRLLRDRRRKRGSIDFDLPEPQVVLDVQGRIEEIVKADRHIGHQIIEEFMIAANEAVARFLDQQGALSLHRVHEAPEGKKIEEFREFVEHLGYPLPLKGKVQPRVFQRLLGQVRGKPEEKSINYLLLRSMKQARYSEENLGHFALATPHYLHFTSPIRRYPDLVVHRILKEVLQHGEMPGRRRQRWEKRLAPVAEHSSQRERLAMEAEREIVDRKKVQFMRDKLGREFYGYISGVLPFGIFVELEDFFVEGLVHLARLPEDHYEYWGKKHTLAGRHTRRFFRLGDRVRVRVEAASLERRQVDFGFVQ
jgi:ribonuclease R